MFDNISSGEGKWTEDYISSRKPMYSSPSICFTQFSPPSHFSLWLSVCTGSISVLTVQQSVYFNSAPPGWTEQQVYTKSGCDNFFFLQNDHSPSALCVLEKTLLSSYLKQVQQVFLQKAWKAWTKQQNPPPKNRSTFITENWGTPTPRREGFFREGRADCVERSGGGGGERITKEKRGKQTSVPKPNHISNRSAPAWGQAQSAVPFNWDN